MIDNKILHFLPFSQEREISTLVENRRAFTLESLELNIYETYKVSERVPLSFDDLVFINMIKGKKVMHINNTKSFEYLPGQMIVLPAEVGMNIDFPEASQFSPTQCTALTVCREKITGVMAYLNEFYPKMSLSDDWSLGSSQFHLYNTPELTELLNKLFQVMISDNPLKNAFVDLIFKELVIKLMQVQAILAIDIGKSSNQVIGFLKNFIHKHISEKLNIEILEKVANMSKSSLTRMFKQELGMSPVEYIIRERLKKSKEILKITRSVKEACFASGFNDVNYFVRQFKNREEITPGAYLLS